MIRDGFYPHSSFGRPVRHHAQALPLPARPARPTWLRFAFALIGGPAIGWLAFSALAAVIPTGRP